MTIEEILNNITYDKVYNKIDLEVKGFTKDTREIKDDDLYFGIKGEHFDGNLLYLDAFNNGASVCILDSLEDNKLNIDYLVSNKKCIILVPNTIKCLGELAKYKRIKSNIFIIAVTGSAGKTSTKDMIFSVLNEKYKTLKTMGNMNNHIGMPLTILSLKDEEYLVLEMGMNHLGEISYLTNIAKPNLAVITNVGTAHIGLLGSRKNILKAKLEILEGLNDNGTLIINNDNDMLHDWYQKNTSKFSIKTFGIYNKSDVAPESYILKSNNSIINYNNETICIPQGGEHFIYNALCAITIGLLCNVDIKLIQQGIEHFVLSNNRMNIINNEGLTIINDSYNANFDAVKGALSYLQKQNGRKIAVLGTMRELGKYSSQLHADLGILIVNNNVDILITVGDYTNLINENAIKNGFNKINSFHFKNNEEASKKINEIKMKNDYILVKASSTCNFKEIVNNIVKK